MRTYITALRASWLAIAVIAGIAGCGGSPDDSGGGVMHLGRKKHPAPKAVATTGEMPLTAMVSAVSMAKSGANVALKFSLLQKPEVGQPLDVDVALVPNAEVDRLSVDFQPGDGLELLNDSAGTRFEKPAEAKPIHVRLRLLPKRDGIFAMGATVATQTGDDTSTRTFSIPVIAGEGLPELAAKPAGSKGL